MIERTLCLIKPDAVGRKVIGEIIHKIENHSFKICQMRMFEFSPGGAEYFYQEHEGNPFFNRLISFMASGPIVALLLEAENAIEAFRNLIGNADPHNARPFSIRQQYGTTMPRIAIHGSDSKESADREISIIFGFEYRAIPENRPRVGEAWTDSHRDLSASLVDDKDLT